MTQDDLLVQLMQRQAACEPTAENWTHPMTCNSLKSIQHDFKAIDVFWVGFGGIQAPVVNAIVFGV